MASTVDDRLSAGRVVVAVVMGVARRLRGLDDGGREGENDGRGLRCF